MEPSTDNVVGRAVRRGARGGEQRQWLVQRYPGLWGSNVRHACVGVPEREKKDGRGVRGSERRKTADIREELLKFEFNNGDSGHMRFRLANVAKPRSSGSNVRDEGNRVVFDSGGSYVEPKSSGKRIPLRRLNGVYAVDARAGCGHVKPKKVFRMQARRL